eukprot:TRINITY_DN4403_c0_g1_i2.p1 TRINITY_DN4403_c0_g1~~TRINITY_DN4403_c0_g1_i2.p1  ORF type:complete len:519 (+),score=62.77 TRINITY_DN4403_c0_g1_i2:126-1682(+)
MSSPPSSYEFLLLFFFLTLSLLQSCSLGATTFRLDLHHRFSEPVKRWAEERSLGGGFRPEDWPERGSVDYYAALAAQDRAVLGHRMMSFSEGNSTFQIRTLGFLHYTTVALGMPSQTYMVALDTGSDLFWVPCDCIRCAPTSSASYGFLQNFELNIYSPNTSLTSKTILCTNSLCEAQRKCSGDSDVCPYKVAYVSSDTSSAGVLVEDVMYLTTEDSFHEVVNARVIFGCGQVQSGSFLDIAAPNGLLGLGMDKLSVPSILSAAGLTTDSFSMCFGSDGVGRILFGDKGGPDQAVTPFNLRESHPTYYVNVTGLLVGTSVIDTTFSALFDTGTSFTYLADPAYTLLSESFNSQARDKRHSPDSRIPFEYCYFRSPAENDSVIPSITLTMTGGGLFSVSEPVFLISTRVYCLAVVKSSSLNIIGQNYMTGQRIVFDREKLVLGWKEFDCYAMEDSSTLPMNPENLTAPGSYSPEATKQTTNESQVSVLPVPPILSYSSHVGSLFALTHLMAFLFLAAIL